MIFRFLNMKEWSNLFKDSARMQWYDIRDYLLGDNMRKQDIKYALNLASTCEYPDARLLGPAQPHRVTRETPDCQHHAELAIAIDTEQRTGV